MGTTLNPTENRRPSSGDSGNACVHSENGARRGWTLEVLLGKDFHGTSLAGRPVKGYQLRQEIRGELGSEGKGTFPEKAVSRGSCAGGRRDDVCAGHWPPG